MTKYEFTLILKGSLELTEELADQFVYSFSSRSFTSTL